MSEPPGDNPKANYSCPACYAEELAAEFRNHYSTALAELRAEVEGLRAAVETLRGNRG